jgi:hypothetical protein
MSDATSLVVSGFGLPSPEGLDDLKETGEA